MKSIWTIIVLTVFVNAHAQQLPQSYDSLVQRILKLETSAAQTQMNLSKAHRQFRTGTAMIIVGVVMSGLSLALNEKQTNSSNQGLAIAGLAFTGVGAIIQIDSHKHVGRAGNFQKKKKDLDWHEKSLN